MTINRSVDELHKAAVEAFRQGNSLEASRFMTIVVERLPESAEAHNFLGVCYASQNLLAEAEKSIRKALSLAESASFYLNLAQILSATRNVDEAAEAYRSSLALDPNSAMACNNLAGILVAQNQYSEAVQLFRRAIRLQPDYIPSQKNLAFALTGLKQFAEAIEIFASIPMHGYQAWAKRTSILWENLAQCDAAYLQELTSGIPSSSSPFCALSVPGITPSLEQTAAYGYAVSSIPNLNAEPMCSKHICAMPIDRPLRIGYLSHDFYNHATMYLFAGVLESHDLFQNEICLFSYGPKRQDDYSRRMQATKIPIIDISDMSDEAAAIQIFERKIDILVDLKGHTGSARSGITALRPAPIIVNWLGYPGTLGHERLADYIIGDPVVTPAEDHDFYSEHIAHMPHCYQPNDRSRPLPEPPARIDVGLPEEGVVFCSFNQTTKFNPQTFDIWGKLIAATPGSVLWLLEPETALATENIRREFRSRGIHSNSIVFAPHVSQSEHIARLQLADLALDAFPCTSHTTASDVLWAGVPLITLKGQTFAGRVAASVLTTHGFSDLVTDMPETYFELALQLAGSAERRKALKERLEIARATSPLFDTVRFTHELEQLYRAMLEDHCKPADQRSRILAAEPSLSVNI